MRIIFTPSKAEGTVKAPPSKSMAHRMLLAAGLADGTSIISNIKTVGSATENSIKNPYVRASDWGWQNITEQA